MTIESLFKKRKTLYYKNLLKYLRYIFNDHFSLVLFFVIGAGGYAYSNYLETLSTGKIGPLVFLALVYFTVVSTASVTLVVEDADQVFLLAKEEAFYPIIKKAVVQSYLQSLFPIALISFLSFPIFSVIQGAVVADGFFIFITLASLKWFRLLVKVYPYFYQNQQQHQKYKRLLGLGTCIAILLMNFLTVRGITYILLPLALRSVYLFIDEKIYFNHSLKWPALIEAENARMRKLYQFIQIFMDVPQKKTKVYRLNILDGILNRFSNHYPKAPYYYLLRLVARNVEYCLLVLRLTLIGGFLLLFFESYLAVILVALLFLYILGFQLISLVKDLEKTPQFQIYPISKKAKIKSSLYLINQLLVLMTIFFTISATINLGIIGMTIFLIGGFGSYLFSYFYVPYRLKE